MNTRIKYPTLAALALCVPQLMMADTPADSVVNVAFGTVAAEDVITATSQVNVAENMKKDFHTYSLDSDIYTEIGGYNGQIWGQDALILVDGVPRDPSDVLASEVETVTVMKDAAAVALYGSRGAKGVVLITTKRGSDSDMRIKFRANAGFYTPKKYAKWLDAASYMTLYNEACRNDGLAERYDAATIYNTAAGTNPYRYPDQKYYTDDYLRKFSSRYSANGEITGGNERTHYYLNLGLDYSNGLIKYGDHKKDYDLRFNVRGNVDMSITKWLTGFTNAAVIVSDNYSARGDFWGMASSMWPNRFATMIPVDMIDPDNASLQGMVGAGSLVDGKYLLGGLSTNQTNAFGDMLKAGYVKLKTRTFMFDVGLKFDLGSILEGLTFNTSYSVDYRAIYSEGYKQDYAVYEPTWGNINGKDVIVDLTKYNNDTNSTSEYIGQSEYKQTMTFMADFNYLRSFGDHNVNGKVLAWGYQTQNSADEGHNSSPYHKISNVNLGFLAAYNYAHRYYATFSGAAVHSARLAPGHRSAFSPTLTLAWRPSAEAFLKDNTVIDDLKIMVSAGRLHQDLDISDYFMWKGYYTDKGGWYQWHDGTAGGNTTQSVRGENLDLTFVTRDEFRAGFDLSLFDGQINLNTNYFLQDTKGGLTNGTTMFPSYFNQWDYSFLPYINYNNQRRQGFDFSLNLNRKFGEFDVSVGFAGAYIDQKVTRVEEKWQNEYQNRAGKPVSSAWGYICDGFFNSQEEIDNAPARQTFGDLKPGDLKYRDMNGDGVINSNDQVCLGKWTAPFYYGVSLTVDWRNFTLYAYGTGNSGATAFNNNSYYLSGGDSKYSENAWLRWTPETKDTALYPRLTTRSTSNNSQTSTFWQYSTSNFTLNRVQLTYNLPEDLFTGKVVKGISVYAEAENLFMIAKNRKIMEQTTFSAPSNRYYNLGCQVTF